MAESHSPFFIPSSVSLKEVLDVIDSRIAALDVLEESMQLHEADLATMAKHLSIQHELLQLMVGDLQRVMCGARLLAAQDAEATKKATQARREGLAIKEDTNAATDIRDALTALKEEMGGMLVLTETVGVIAAQLMVMTDMLKRVLDAITTANALARQR